MYYLDKDDFYKHIYFIVVFLWVRKKRPITHDLEKIVK